MIAIGIIVLASRGCRNIEAPPERSRINSDAELFTLVTQTEPFTSYVLFPLADSVTSGTLNGSNAHRPLVRVSMNATAYNALQGDTLPAGSMFPDSSIIFKQIIGQGETILYAIMYKERNNPRAGNSWLWAELEPGGGVLFSITRAGSGCTSCHSLERGWQNDLVRTFERQRR
jgi:hypothetical protein